MSTIVVLLRITPILLALFLPIFVLKQSPKNKLNQKFAITHISLCLWALLILIQDLFWKSLGNDILYCLGVLCGEIYLVSNIFLTANFPGKKIKIKPKIKIILITISIIFSIIILSGKFYIPTTLPIHKKIMELNIYGISYAIFVLTSICSVLLMLTYKFKKTYLRKEKQQIKSIIIGYMLGGILVAIFNINPYIMPKSEFMNALGYTSIFFVNLGVYFAITKSQAFNIKTAIHQSIIWTILSTVTLGLLMGVINKTIPLTQLSYTNPQNTISPLLLSYHLIPSLIIIGLGIFIFLKNKTQKINQLALLTLSSIGFWSLLILIQDLFYISLGHNHFYNIAMVMGITTLTSQLILFLKFPGKPIRLPKPIFWTLISIAIFFTTQALQSKMYLPTEGPIHDKIFLPSKIGRLYLDYEIGIFIAISFILIFKFIKEKSQTIRIQLIYILVGMLLTALFVIKFNLSESSFGQSDFLNAVGYGSVIFMALGMYLAIAKGQAFDIKTGLHQTIFWAIISSLLIISIYSSGTYYLYHNKQFQSKSFIIILLIYSIFHLYMKHLQPQIDNLFFRKRHQYAKTLQKITTQLSNIHSIRELNRLIFNVINTKLYPKDITLYFQLKTKIVQYAPEKTTKSLPKHTLLPSPKTDELHIPIGTSNNPIGLIVLNEKKSLRSYTSVEKEFLHQFSEKIARHMESILLFDTIQKQTEQLIQTQKEKIKLETEASRALEQQNYIQDLSYLISHEVKNSLYTIETTLDILSKKQFTTPTEKDDIFNHINEECNKLLKFSQKYLLNKTLSLEFKDIKKETLNLSQLINSIILKHKSKITQRQLKIVRESPSLLQIKSDIEKLKILLDNLIQNAINYSPEASTIQIKNSHTPTHHTITIADEGPGIPQIIKDQIGHNKPIQTPNPRKKFSTGFGLLICHKITKQLGGEIKIKGLKKTTISIKLPQ